MKLVRYYEEGDSSVLKLEEAPVPEPGEGDVLLNVDVAGVSMAEVLQRQGKYITRVNLPHIPGGRMVGTVEKVGPGVDPSMMGRQYMGLVRTGANAEKAVGTASVLREIPKGVNAVDAYAILAEADVAAMVYRIAGRLQPGESVYVPAATGGVGYMAVQLAFLYGAAKVFGAASSDAKRAMVAELGAIPIDYTKEGWAKEVIAQTDGKGVDLSLECNGGQWVYDTLEATRVGGRMVNYGNLTDTNAPVNPRQLLRRNQALIGFSRGNSITDNLYLEEKRVIAQELDDFILAGKIKPLIAGTFTLDNVHEAHEMLERREGIGKVILKPNG